MTERISADHDGLTASQEDYLEAIYHISADKRAARAKDIAACLGVRASSVTGALRLLGRLGLVNYAPYDLITLTAQGWTVAEEIVRRHSALEHFLVHVLGIDQKEADQAACKMEHAVSKDIVRRLIQYAEHVEQCPKGGLVWAAEQGYQCRRACTEEACGRAHKVPPQAAEKS